MTPNWNSNQTNKIIKRSEFLRNLSILALIGILECSSSTQTKVYEEFMGKAEGKSGATATVHFKVVDKNGNVKEKGVAKGKFVGNSEQKIKRG